jgi:hypothetical protein
MATERKEYCQPACEAATSACLTQYAMFLAESVQWKVECDGTRGLFREQYSVGGTALHCTRHSLCNNPRRGFDRLRCRSMRREVRVVVANCCVF